MIKIDNKILYYPEIKKPNIKSRICSAKNLDEVIPHLMPVSCPITCQAHYFIYEASCPTSSLPPKKGKNETNFFNIVFPNEKFPNKHVQLFYCVDYNSLYRCVTFI